MNRILIIFIIILAVSTRLVAHPYNFTPVLAFSLLAGVYSKNKFGFLLPISIMLISDYFIGMHDTILIVYLSLFAVYLIGYYAIKNINAENIFLGSFLGPLIFFIITNFAVWMNDGVLGMYTDNFIGLIDCYYRALPFFKNTLISTVFFAGVIHASYLLLYEKFAILKSNR